MSEVDNLLANDHVLVGYVSEGEKKKSVVHYVKRVLYQGLTVYIELEIQLIII